MTIERTLIHYELIKTNRRLTFDIIWQHPCVTFAGEDDGPYLTYTANNNYQIISRSRMDIQTERLWLRGGTEDDRSGSMVFSSNEKRDAAYDAFEVAIQEWHLGVLQGYIWADGLVKGPLILPKEAPDWPESFYSETFVPCSFGIETNCKCRCTGDCIPF